MHCIQTGYGYRHDFFAYRDGRRIVALDKDGADITAQVDANGHMTRMLVDRMLIPDLPPLPGTQTANNCPPI